MSLALCEECGLLVNTAFDESRIDYDEDYENSLHFSKMFGEYAQWLARGIVERYDVRGKEVLEIGCGSGEFLQLLVDLGDNRGIGFDPALDSAALQCSDDRLRLVKAYYSDVYEDVKPDVVVARQLLEHVSNPLGFLVGIREAVHNRPNVTIVMEVPNALEVLQTGDIWNIIYEHPLYFTPTALRSLFQRAGYRVRRVVPTYEDNFLVVEASPGVESDALSEEELAVVRSATEAFRETFHARIAYWEREASRISTQGLRTMLWGAGARGDTFLNVTDMGKVIGGVVDVNPRKWGRYMAGTAQQIQSPETLVDLPPDVVVIANAIYEKEIGASLERMQISAEILIA